MAAPAQSASKSERLKAFLISEAHAAGFDVARVVAPDAIAGKASSGLDAYLKKGRHGTMQWLAETRERRSDPRTLWPEVGSILMLGMNYGPGHNPLDVLAHKDRAAISVYAQNRDYHDLIKGKLKGVAGRFAARAGGDVKVFVDTAPVMEKPLAEQAGLGWQGKHSNLVSREFGSWLFLGSIFTTAKLPPDDPEIDHCGSCRACLDICPTDAFPAPYQLDARRCISYLTIEHNGPIPDAFRKAIGNRIYGCDDCLAVCPWNKFAINVREAKLRARDDLKAAALADLVTLDDAAFRALFSGSPVKRTGRNRFLRNVLIACGNSGDVALIEPCRQCLDDKSAGVRGAAVWALSQLLDREDFLRLNQGAAQETDDSVRHEWHMAATQQQG
ncbi:MAG: tRNA epoxyqueuosine(34) reductase QueG [Hyphomicrobiales bacterium]|nr:tRNA epoxyqueuosine(34) reductase QueG [Hyphomicrobiales bacterium]MCP4999239.1 tRNA epoxyqueuosine(34) reductase QueG [Hyphomicrobiales bacterium]